MKKIRTLIVDDHIIVRRGLKDLLEDDDNIEIIGEADSGFDALKILEETLPDVILMDVVMPGMNGFQATRKLSTIPATSAIPVIIVTTKDQETDKVWGIRQGAKDYIVKPVKEKDLIDRVNAALSGG